MSHMELEGDRLSDIKILHKFLYHVICGDLRHRMSCGVLLLAFPHQHICLVWVSSATLFEVVTSFDDAGHLFDKMVEREGEEGGKCLFLRGFVGCIKICLEKKLFMKERVGCKRVGCVMMASCIEKWGIVRHFMWL